MVIKKCVPTTLIFLLFLLMPFEFVMGQVSWSGQIRHRAEWDGKDFSNDTKLGGFGLLRSRLNFTFKDDHSLAFFQVQDSRKFGTEVNTLTDGSADALDVHQAYLKINNIFGQPVSAKVGRMEMIYANERLIGAVGWHNIGRSFDGVVMTYSGEKFDVDVFSLKVVELDNAGNEGDFDFRGVWTTTSFSKLGATRLDFYYLNDVTLPGDNFDRITLGFYSKGKYSLGSLTLFQETDYALQRGSNSADIKASLLGIRVGIQLLNLPFKPEIGFGYDAVSGDDPATPEYEAFSTLYATNHKYYGFMDYFLNVPVHTQHSGLTDVILKGALSPIPEKSTLGKLRLKADIHAFSTRVDVDGETAIGTEVDVTTVFPYRKNVKIVGGYSHFTPNTVFKSWKGGDPATWIYLMTIYNF